MSRHDATGWRIVRVRGGTVRVARSWTVFVFEGLTYRVPRANWLRAIAVMLVLWCAGCTQTPPVALEGYPLVAGPLPSLPGCESVLAATGGAETIVVRRSGRTATVMVVYSGVDRGQLVHIDIDSRTMWIPNRPPFGWSIGSDQFTTGPGQ
jgi:hypothetical protein